MEPNSTYVDENDGNDFYCDDDLMLLSDDEFRDLVDDELRRDHRHTSEKDRARLEDVFVGLQQPEVLARWIGVLTMMKKSAEQQLGARRDDLKKQYGQISTDEYGKKRSEYLRWRASTLRFLTTLESRLAVGRSRRRQYFPSSYPEQLVEERNRLSGHLLDMMRAVRQHRDWTVREYDATDADRELWSTIDRTED